MKILAIIFFAIAFFVSCSEERELQVERTTLKLQKIDTLYRYGGDVFKYTWLDIETKLVYSEYSSNSIETPTRMLGIIKR